ncbi:hypothetical protein GGS23DRAFT_439013 [Durotheca rogersii]|uniref:uncharacterized protein n=1 Tax=Durotheca rogersii TaxID=419775 RepID=UPI00221F2B0C|nr:uncharacterized protein GGS23DRAFT_439013 [Durotheca rogersii]KAI5856169.1 hypothetical protein GGS23DRAFT_439013 [Durotheca rogersii]
MGRVARAPCSPASSAVTFSSAYSSGSREVVCCDYCARNGLTHSPYDHYDLWTKCMESRGPMAALEFLIWLQMCLLSVLVPFFFLLVLGVYIMGYIDRTYVGPSSSSASFPKVSGDVCR